MPRSKPFSMPTRSAMSMNGICFASLTTAGAGRDQDGACDSSCAAVLVPSAARPDLPKVLLFSRILHCPTHFREQFVVLKLANFGHYLQAVFAKLTLHVRLNAPQQAFLNANPFRDVDERHMLRLLVIVHILQKE